MQGGSAAWLIAGIVLGLCASAAAETTTWITAPSDAKVRCIDDTANAKLDALLKWAGVAP